MIALERRGKLFLALVLKCDKDKDKLEVYLESGEKVSNISENKIIYSFQSSLPADNEKSMKLALKESREKFAQNPVDLEMLWQCLENEDGYEFKEMVDSYFGQTLDSEAGAMFVALIADNLYFHYRNGQFAKVTAETITAKLRQEQSEKQNRDQQALVSEWLRNDKSIEIDLQSEQIQKLLQGLNHFALVGEEKATIEGKRLANALGLTPDEALILLEQKGLLAKDVNENVYRYELVTQYPAAVISESEMILEQPADYPRHYPAAAAWNIAIDDDATKEVDDAIGYHRQGEYQIVGVHIADVAWQIPQGGELDRFAADRFATLYFPEERHFLFPLPLIQKRLTLAVGQPRPVISGFFYFDDQGNLQKSHFQRTLFTLARKATYEQSFQLLSEAGEFQQLRQIAQQLRAARISQGAVITELPGIKIKVNDGEVTLERCDYTPGDMMISEFMVLYNTTLAQQFVERDLNAFFRIQPSPIAPIEASHEDPLYPLKMRWGLSPTSLSLHPAPHHTLGVPAYVQGSSPMRRYSDLVMQRLLVSCLEKTAPPYSSEQLQRIKTDCERTEKAVKAAEYSRNQFWIYRYLNKHKGPYQGYVSRVLDHRVMVYIPELLQELPLKGEPSLNKVGKAVTIKVLSASPRKRRVHLEKLQNGDCHAFQE